MFSISPGIAAKYLSKDFEDFDFPDTILPWQQATTFCQQWMNLDAIAQQLQTNVGPVAWVLKAADGAVVDTLLFVQGAQSENDPTMFIYEILVPLIGYPVGCYYIELQFGNPMVFNLRSGEFNIAANQPNTLLLEYKHFQFREDVIYETGFFPSLRVRATKKYIGPKQKTTVYNDNSLNTSVLRAVKFRIWELIIGGARGIPDYLADLIGGAIGCSTFLIDGKAYACPDGSELEPTEIENFPMRGWRIELRERYNRASREYLNDDPINVQLTAMVNVDSKGFGNSVSGNQTAILDVE